MGMKVEVVVGDIARQNDMEAVVNSANPNLRMGSGVAGAIHMAAGAELEDYCEPLAPVARGRAVITPGFNLPNRWVIHTVAESFIDNPEADRVLALAIDSALRLATEHGIQSLAMPAIGTPLGRATLESAEASREVSQKMDALVDILAGLNQTMVKDVLPEWVKQVENSQKDAKDAFNQAATGLSWTKWAVITSVVVKL